MKITLLCAFAIATSFSTAASLAPSYAQGLVRPAPPGVTQGQSQAQGQPGEEQEASAADKAAFLNARLAALKAVLDLTPDQEKLWTPLEAAVRDAAKESAERANKLHNTPEPTSVVELLNIVADHELARAQALKKFVTALQPLVASLTPEQKRRVLTFLGLGAPGPHGPSSGDLWIFEEED